MDITTRRLSSIGAGVLLLAGMLHGEVFIDLKYGIVTELNGTNPQSSTATTFQSSDGYVTVRLERKPNNACAATPYEALAAVSLTPAGSSALTKLSVTVEYDGVPSGWTTHLGDDSANDGYGGGRTLAGTAEVQVVDQNLAVYSTGLAPGVVEKIASSNLRLREGAMHFNVSDQSLTYGQPYTQVDSKNLRQLFDFSSADRTIYASFNRVIAGRTDRRGCGARRVVLAFE